MEKLTDFYIQELLDFFSEIENNFTSCGFAERCATPEDICFVCLKTCIPLEVIEINIYAIYDIAAECIFNIC